MQIISHSLNSSSFLNARKQLDLPLQNRILETLRDRFQRESSTMVRKLPVKSLRFGLTHLEQELHNAVENGEIVKLTNLLNTSNLNLNAVDKNGWTALHKAAKKRNLNILFPFMHAIRSVRNINIDAVTPQGRTPFHLAALMDNNLISHPMPASREFNPQMIERSKEVLTLLKTLGVNINAWDTQENNALHLAAFEGNYEILLHLLKLGVNPRKKNQSELTPLDIAVAKNQVDVIRLILKVLNFHVGHTSETLNSFLHNEQLLGNPSTLRAIIHLGGDVNNKKPVTERNPLHRAIMFDKLGAIKILVDSKAKIDAKDNKGNTPFHLAIQLGNMKLMKELLDCKADPSIPNKAGQTPLMVAQETGNGETFKKVLRVLNDSLKKATEHQNNEQIEKLKKALDLRTPTRAEEKMEPPMGGPEGVTNLSNNRSIEFDGKKMTMRRKSSSEQNFDNLFIPKKPRR